jgi:hypothetical protein
MKKIEFWISVSNYSIAVCGVALIARMFFRKYLESIIIPILIVGGIALILSIVAELMKFILKRKS